LIVMGGSMSIDDYDEHPWLEAEKALIKQAIGAGKHVLGICLGAQLIADVLGARVYRGEHKEIGWFDVQTSQGLQESVWKDVFPISFTAFHWHGDTFNLPQGALSIGQSDACKQQGFIFDQRVVALQFHLETTPESAKALINNCKDELDGSTYVQSAAEILGNAQRFVPLNHLMHDVLKKWSVGC